MQNFSVSWEIDIWADTPKEAARQALKIQRDPKLIANVFDITDEQGETVRVDLLELDEKE